MDSKEGAFKGAEQLKARISQIEEKCSRQSENASNNDVIMKKLADVKADYAEILKESEAIKEAQKEAAEFFKSHISLACTALMKLQLQQQQNTNEIPEELIKLEEMLGVKSITAQTDKTDGNTEKKSNSKEAKSSDEVS